MSRSEQLYTEITNTLEQFHTQLHRRRLANWVWVIVGMILAKSVQLSAIANHIPDSTEAVARITKVRRWLKNPRIDTQTLYEPIIRHVLEQWANREVTIMLDGCFCMAIACRCCASVFRTATARSQWPGKWSQVRGLSHLTCVSQCLNTLLPCSS